MEILSSFIWNGKRFRIIWNRLFWFHPYQTFHEFPDYLAVLTLNKEWLKRQLTLPESEQHVIVYWRKALISGALSYKTLSPSEKNVIN
jgi:hypothetical protein